MDRVERSNEEWKKELDEETFRVTRQQGTEAPFSGKYWDHHGEGMYRCSNCKLPLFPSNTKFDSGTGWPSFDEPAHRENIELIPDASHGMQRTEVRCARCGAHLGHLFNDGPTKTGARYCINSCSLNFEGEGAVD